jgi:hypothetical protein
MTIKAIETHYKGFRFRSRLEARYAVFFDQAGANWDYEQEGYNLDGEYYLPDFKVNKLIDKNGVDVPLWFEIKPELQDCQSDDVNRASLLMGRLVSNTNRAGFLCFGPPHKAIIVMFEPAPEFSNGVCRNVGSFKKCTDLFPAIRKAQSARFEHGENSNV